MALKRYCTSQTTLEPKTLESNKSVVGLGTAALMFFYLQVLEEVGRTYFPHVSCVM